MGLRDFFRNGAKSAAQLSRFHSDTVVDRERRDLIRGIEIPAEIRAFTTGTMPLKTDGSFPEITVRFDARRNEKKGGWDIRKFTEAKESEALAAAGVAPGQDDAYVGHAGCDFDALRFLSEESAARGFRAQQSLANNILGVFGLGDTAGHRDMPHWKAVAAQIKQPIDKNGIVQPVVKGQVLADRVTFDDQKQIEIRDSTLPPAVVPVEQVKQKQVSLPPSAQKIGFLKRAFGALMPRPAPGELLEAAMYNDKGRAEWLVARGADVNAKNVIGWTALMLADAAIVRLLLENGADVNAKNNHGNTALMRAVSEGHTDTVRLLVEKNADVNIENEDGKTALDWAKRGNHAEIVQILREAMEKQKQSAAPPPRFAGANPG